MTAPSENAKARRAAWRWRCATLESIRTISNTSMRTAHRRPWATWPKTGDEARARGPCLQTLVSSTKSMTAHLLGAPAAWRRSSRAGAAPRRDPADHQPGNPGEAATSTSCRTWRREEDRGGDVERLRLRGTNGTLVFQDLNAPAPSRRPPRVRRCLPRRPAVAARGLAPRAIRCSGSVAGGSALDHVFATDGQDFAGRRWHHARSRWQRLEAISSRFSTMPGEAALRASPTACRSVVAGRLYMATNSPTGRARAAASVGLHRPRRWRWRCAVRRRSCATATAASASPCASPDASSAGRPRCRLPAAAALPPLPDWNTPSKSSGRSACGS